MVHDKETGRLRFFRAEYRHWWWPFWKPVLSENPAGQAGSYDNALRSIARTMAVPGGPIKTVSEFV